MPKVSIGLPVYNGEKFLNNALESLLSQTFTDFEIIISDNASTDSTQTICEKFAKQDKRIRYIRQKCNIGMFSNFIFVLKQSTSKYFQWAAADDLWHPTFLEQNLMALESDNTLIGSISNVGEYDVILNNWRLVVKNTSASNLKYHSVKTMSGSYSKKIGTYLKLRQVAGIYGVYVREKLSKSISDIKEFYLWDFELVLATIKFGNLYVVDEILMYKFTKGETGNQTPLEYQLSLKSPLYVILFPHLFFIIRCFRRFGIIVSVKNLHLILRYLAQGESQLILDLFTISKRKLRHRLID